MALTYLISKTNPDYREAELSILFSLTLFQRPAPAAHAWPQQPSTPYPRTTDTCLGVSIEDACVVEYYREQHLPPLAEPRRFVQITTSIIYWYIAKAYSTLLVHLSFEVVQLTSFEVVDPKWPKTGHLKKKAFNLRRDLLIRPRRCPHLRRPSGHNTVSLRVQQYHNHIARKNNVTMFAKCERGVSFFKKQGMYILSLTPERTTMFLRWQRKSLSWVRWNTKYHTGS